MKPILFVLFSLMIVSIYATNILAQDKEGNGEKLVLHRYLVERTFPDGLNIPMDQLGSDMCLAVVSNNAEDNVTWIHSYVTMDKKKSYCIYDAPSPDAIRKSAKMNGLPVDNIIEVSVLDPYFYK